MTGTKHDQVHAQKPHSFLKQQMTKCAALKEGDLILIHKICRHYQMWSNPLRLYKCKTIQELGYMRNLATKSS